MKPAQIRRPRSLYKPSPFSDEAIQLAEPVSPEVALEVESASMVRPMESAPTAKGSPEVKTPRNDSGIGLLIDDPNYRLSWPEAMEPETEKPQTASPDKKMRRKAMVVPKDTLVFEPDQKRQLARQRQAKRRSPLAQGSLDNTTGVQEKKVGQKEKVRKQAQPSQVKTPVIHGEKTAMSNTASPVQAPPGKKGAIKRIVRALGQGSSFFDYLKSSASKRSAVPAKRFDVIKALAAEKRLREEEEDTVEDGGPSKRVKFSLPDASTKTVTPPATTAEEKGKNGKDTVLPKKKIQTGKRTEQPTQKAPIKEARKKLAAGEETGRKPEANQKKLGSTASRNPSNSKKRARDEGEEEHQHSIKRAKPAALATPPSSRSRLVQESPLSSRDAMGQTRANPMREARKEKVIAKAMAGMEQYRALQAAKRARK